MGGRSDLHLSTHVDAKCLRIEDDLAGGRITASVNKFDPQRFSAFVPIDCQHKLMNPLSQIAFPLLANRRGLTVDPQTQARRVTKL